MKPTRSSRAIRQKTARPKPISAGIHGSEAICKDRRAFCFPRSLEHLFSMGLTYTAYNAEAIGLEHGGSMAQASLYDAKKVAYYEVEGWKAYYDRDWLRLLRLIVSLAQAQFH